MEKLLLATDLHYLPPQLYTGSSVLVQALRRSDGKMPHCGEELLRALEKEISDDRPDALVIPGDLSLNGERAAHERLASFLGRIRENGTPVWVIPGNHDILNPAARDYSGTESRPAPGVTANEFYQIYQAFMRPREGGEGANLSYHVQISPRLWLAMLDGCLYRNGAQVPGAFTADHAAWLEGVLRRAREAGAEVITVTHHSAVPQTRFAQDSFALRGNEELCRLLCRYGVRLNLSGHLHIQHIAHDASLTDASTGSLSVCPHFIAHIGRDDSGMLRYEARPLRLKYLPPDFHRISREWFSTVSRGKNRAALDSLPAIGPEEKAKMADFSARFNLAYYSGGYHSDDLSWQRDPAYRLWQKWPVGIFGAYFNQVIREENGEHRTWSSGGAFRTE